MKIAIIGYSGAGKSTLARKLGTKYNIEPLHLDCIYWLPGWKSIDTEEGCKKVIEYLDTHNEWIIDGNYSKYVQERRLEEADIIIEMLFGRFNCLRRAKNRYKKYKGTSRPDLTQGCDETFDKEFVEWILYKGRTKRTRKHYKDIKNKYPNKVIILKNQRQLDRYIKDNGICE